MKTIQLISVWLLATQATCAAAGAQQAVEPSPDHPEWAAGLKAGGTPITVYTAKKIYTMDPARPEVQAVAVLDGRVLSTGTLESMKPWLSRYKYTVNDTLKDKIVMPGFIEPHSHMYMSAGFMSSLYIGPMEWPGPNGMNAASPTHADVIATLKQAIAQGGDTTEPLIAWGFDPAKQGGSLERKELDSLSAKRPIFVIAFAPHFAYLNTPAIALTGLKPDTTIHGVYKNPDGSLSGVFNENVAMQAALGPVFPRIISMGGVKGLKFMARIAQRAGVTTVADLAYGSIDFDVEWKDSLAAASDPGFPVRMPLVADGNTLDLKYKDKALETYRAMQRRNNDRVWVDGVKFFTDGSLPLMSSRVNFPGYLDGSNGSFNAIPWNQLSARMAPYWKAGIRIHMHANGDMAVDQALDSLAELQDMKPRFDHRYTIEHFSISNSMQARRIKALGANVSVNIYFTHFRSQLHSENAYGPDRSAGFARLKDLEREGVVFALHSDYPQVTVPMLPLTGVWTAVNRIAEDGKTVQDPGERIAVDRALRAVTIDAAYILGVEDKLGSLEPGKFADFVVLGEDPYAVDPIKIKDIPVWGTALSGKLFKSGK